ncbi:MAG: DUF899 family protein [Minwuia sp.]|nr:DUF899 family protein [Minwuia sp.]
MSMKFPNESATYRAARNRLLDAEADLRQRTEDVAALRRALPPGGDIPEDYGFHDADGAQTPLSSLFADGQDTLALYSFMLAPDATVPCPMCTGFVDALDGAAPHIRARMGLEVGIGGTCAQARELKAARGWQDIRVLSFAGTTYNRAYHGEGPDGSQWPMLNVFQRQGQTIRHFWSTELFRHDWGGHPRHMDPAWPLWTFLDWSPAGRGDFFPSLNYD